jgi:hypothetical protein
MISSDYTASNDVMIWMIYADISQKATSLLFLSSRLFALEIYLFYIPEIRFYYSWQSDIKDCMKSTF